MGAAWGVEQWAAPVIPGPGCGLCAGLTWSSRYLLLFAGSALGFRYQPSTYTSTWELAHPRVDSCSTNTTGIRPVPGTAVGISTGGGGEMPRTCSQSAPGETVRKALYKSEPFPRTFSAESPATRSASPFCGFIPPPPRPLDYKLLEAKDSVLCSVYPQHPARGQAPGRYRCTSVTLN